MTQTLGSSAQVRWDRRPDRLNRKATEKDFRQIFHLAAELWDVWADAVDGGVWAPKTDNGGRGTGFHDLKPTESAVFSPTRRQMRYAAKQASVAIPAARAHVEFAADLLPRAQLPHDPEVLARFVEIREPATQR